MSEILRGLRAALTGFLAVIFVAILAFMLVAIGLLAFGTLVATAAGAGGPLPASVAALILVLFAIVVAAFLGRGYRRSLPAGAPSVTFDLDATDGEATVVHDGGDEIDAETLVVAVDGTSRGSWASHSDVDRVTDGDAISIVDVDRGDEVTVRWTDGDSSASLFSETA